MLLMDSGDSNYCLMASINTPVIPHLTHLNLWPNHSKHLEQMITLGWKPDYTDLCGSGGLAGAREDATG